MELYIGSAGTGDEPALRELWKRCFGDEDSYIDMVFRRRFSPENTVTAKVGGTVVGAVHLLPAELDGRPACYGYAVATAPEYRGRGVCRAMHRFIFESARKSGFSYMVRPANRELFGMYEKLGMKTAFYEGVHTFSFPEVQGRSAMRKARPEEYLALRERYFGSMPGLVRWDRQAVAYAIEETEYCGGSCLMMRIGGESCAVLARPAPDDTVFVTEAAADFDSLPELARALSRTSGRKNVKIRRPEGNTPSGMLYGEELSVRGYLNLTLD